MSNQSELFQELSDEQQEELRYRLERSIEGNMAAIWDVQNNLIALLMFADELTLCHLMTPEKTLEVAEQLHKLATQARSE